MNKKIEQSEVVILWGIDTSADNLLPYLESKKVIVINPTDTKATKLAELDVKIRPHCDVFFALMLSRFLFISDMIDEDYLSDFASDYQDFYDLTQEFRIVLTLEKIGLDITVVKNLLEIVDGKKLIIVCGNGLKSSVDYDETKEAINAFGVLLGLFHKDGCGVLFVDGDSYKTGIDLENDEFEFIDEIDTGILKKYKI